MSASGTGRRLLAQEQSNRREFRRIDDRRVVLEVAAEGEAVERRGQVDEHHAGIEIDASGAVLEFPAQADGGSMLAA
jgi:hypothetical protein